MCALQSKSMSEMHFTGIWRPSFQNFPLSALLTQQTLKKLNFWEKTAVEKSAWIKACYDVNADETWLSGIGFV